MADIQSPRLLYFKGGLMLLTGILASTLLLAGNPSIRCVLLLAVAVWGFARAYYFAFYVVEHYIDPGFRYAGLLDFVRHHLRAPVPSLQQSRVRPDSPNRTGFPDQTE